MDIGIIGGADGPTTIFLASPLSPVWLLVGAALVLAAVAGLIVWRKKGNTHKK